MRSVNPWAQLRSYPGWRGLEEQLRELARLLWQVGGTDPTSSYALDLSETIGALLTDPLYAHGFLPENYAISFAAAKGAPRSEELESELLGWLNELTRLVVDVPALLAAGDSALHLGPALSNDLPRAWQARFGPILFQLRQMLRSAPSRKAKGGAREEPEWLHALGSEEEPRGTDGPWRYVAADVGGFRAVVPEGADTAAAWRELPVVILQELGLDAARLHLALLCRTGDAVACQALYRAMGLSRQAGRALTAERCLTALDQLRAQRLVIYRWSQQGYERSTGNLWEVKIREYGQGRMLEQGGTLVTHGQDWTAIVPPASQAPWAAEMAEAANAILEEAEGRLHPVSLSLGALLLAASGRPVAVRNADLLRIARVTDRSPQPNIWRALRTAVRLQQKWGWTADLSGWPAEAGRLAARGESFPPDLWDEFLQAAALFQ